jgi:phosphoserine phosphatase RsbU/P
MTQCHLGSEFQNFMARSIPAVYDFLPKSRAWPYPVLCSLCVRSGMRIKYYLSEAGSEIRHSNALPPPLQNQREPPYRARLDLLSTPRAFPRIRGIDYYGEGRRASELQRDFFVFARFLKTKLLLFLGDVSGPGLGFHIIAAGLENLLHSEPVGGLEVLVQSLNRSICDISAEGLYATLFCAAADATRRQLSYVSAGHEPVLLLNQSTGWRRLESTGTVLGLTTRSVYRAHTVAMEPGDILAAFTDGITEAKDAQGREFREEGVLRILHQHAAAGAAELSAAVILAAQRFGGGSRAADDQTVAVVKFAHAAAEEPVRREAEELALAAA